MKLETAEITAKGVCYLAIGFFTPLISGLAQWGNSGEWPGRIVWVIMGASCIVGGATQLLSFLSGSYSGYKSGLTNGAPPLPEPPPKPSPSNPT